MSKFNIGDAVIDSRTNESGVITDRMYSEARSQFVYVIKPSDGGRSFTREEDEVEPFYSDVEYKIETVVEDGVVICTIYEVCNGIKTEVCRGHEHIIHDGAVGIAQACAYATKRALYTIDNGIYFKQKREGDEQ